MKVSELTTEQLALLLQDLDWNVNYECYAEGDQQPDFFDENEFGRAELLEGLGLTDDQDVTSSMLNDLKELEQLN